MAQRLDADRPRDVLEVVRGPRLPPDRSDRGGRKAGVLRVAALYLEDGSTAGDQAAIEAELAELAAWLKLERVEVERVVRGA